MKCKTCIHYSNRLNVCTFFGDRDGTVDLNKCAEHMTNEENIRRMKESVKATGTYRI